MTTNKYKFLCSGGFDVDANLDRIYDDVGNVVGFQLPDGRKVRLVIGLEVESDTTLIHVTNEFDMDDLGINLTDYDECELRLCDE